MAHIRPGTLTDFILYTQGTNGDPKITTLPLRSVRISFPTKPDVANETYVRFDGEFGVSYSDSRYLWKILKNKRYRRRLQREFSIIVDNTSTSVPTGSYGTFSASPQADGNRLTFYFETNSGIRVGLMAGQFSIYLNGLYQRPNIDYNYNSSAMDITFVTAPDPGDSIYATGYVTS